MNLKNVTAESTEATEARQWVDRYHWLVIAVYAFSAILFLLLGSIEWQRLGETANAQARERGRGLFRLIELTREWNAGHGTVYVPVSDTVTPNPYLEHPQRDVTTTDGRRLTMINPAYMTRQLGEMAEDASGLRFHITSLKPIRPANAADPWETEAMRAFEAGGETERIEYIERYSAGDVRVAGVHRYMAPLYVKAVCLKCHENQGYRIGEVRGGISVTMPAADLLAVRDQRRMSNAVIMLFGFIITSSLLHLLLARARRHYRMIKSLMDARDGVISARTRELAERNGALQREIEERRRAERELRLAGAVFESAAEGIVVTDADNRIVRVNPAFTVITGYTPKEVLGHNPSLLKSGRHDAAFYADMWGTLNERGHWEGEIWNRHKSGDICVEWLSISRIEDEHGAGQYLAVFHDITRRKQAEDLLRHKAHHDPLTDLPNRELFGDRLRAAFSQARRYHRRFALLLVDLDHFKEVNDTLGHAAGDQLLVEAARRLVSCVRESDTVARLGGDEFALILSEMTTEEEAEMIARRAVELLAEPYYLDAGAVRTVSGCVGIALYPQHGQDSDALLRNADTALYAAKDGGRDTYRLYAAKARPANVQGDLL